MTKIDVCNLDGSKHLATFLDIPYVITPRTFNITEEIEKRVGIPVENQVIFVNGKKLTGYTELRLDPFVVVSLGYQSTTKTDVDYKLYSKFNGLFVNTSIWSKFRGHEILGRFNSNPSSTYLDLKLYIEIKLNIPTDLQVILRKDLKKHYYWEPKNDEYLINYMFGDGDPKHKKKNVVYLMVKESTRYVSNRHDIIKIKPTSIYSQHGPEMITKIMTFSPEECILNISEIKSKIEKQLGLSTASQIIYRLTDKIGIKPLGMNYAGDLLHSVFHCFASFQKEVVLYLTCDSNGDEKSSQICKKYGIKILEVQIKTPSGNVIAKCKTAPRSTTFGSLKTVVEKRHKLSIRKQLFYGTDFNVLDDQESIWGHFGWQMVNSTCTVYIFMKKTESKGVDEICDQLDIPQISPDVVIKSLGGIKELLKTNMDRFENTSIRWFNCLIQDIKEKLQPPSEFVLSFCGEILHENHALARRDWKDFCFREGVVQEEITFNLTFTPPLTAREEKFCKNHHISTLKTLKVKFLTSEMGVNLRKEAMESILKVKGIISEKKKIPARAIDIFFNGRMLNDHENLMVLFVKEYSSPTSLEFNVVIKTINVEINLKSPYITRLTLLVDYITLPGLKTFYNVKEDIASLTGISISQLRITCSQAPDVSNKTFIQDLVCDQSYPEIEVNIWKTVTIRIVGKNGNTKTQKHDIANDDETVYLLLSTVNSDNRLKLQNKGNISRDTLLHDLGSDDIIELTEKKESSCKLM